MNPEREALYEIEVEVADLNADNLLKPYGYQKLFAQLAERHLNKYQMNTDDTMKMNLAWVLVALTFEIKRPVYGSMKLIGKTWYSLHQGPYFRRELEFKDEAGETVFCGSTFSILFNFTNRSIYHKKELPFSIFDPIEEFTIEAKPTSRISGEFSSVVQRQAQNSQIDCLGHVNNCRYGEFAYDVFTPDEVQRLGELKRMEFYFAHELRNKDLFTVYKAGDGNRLFVRGYNDTQDKKAFDVILQF